MVKTWVSGSVTLAALAYATAANAQTPPPAPASPSAQTEPAPPTTPAPEAASQTATPAAPGRATDLLTEDIIVTATKKIGGESLQTVPISATVLGGAQIDLLQLKSIETLAFKSPNVQLDSVGTQRGIANFTIRGIGVNSSVPTVEPAVGTFVDGVYLGTNQGVTVDTFDIESVEILRGPQGVLFGRNVTGGAVSLRTRRPTGETSFRGRASFEVGDRGNPVETIASSVEGSLVPDSVFAKLTGYYSHDGGYFGNATLGRNAGRANTWFVRPTIVFKPSSTFDTTLIGEFGRDSGDGTVVRKIGGTVPVPKFKSLSGNPGDNDFKRQSLTSETNIAVGNGVITNVAGYRRFTQTSNYDVDGTAANIYNIFYDTKQSQFSEELRYASRFFDRVDFVTGLYYFHQNIALVNRDDLQYISRFRDYGGKQKSHSFGVFVNTDTNITDKLKLGLGLRYSVDKKHAKVVTGVLTPAPQLCSLTAGTCSTYPFDDRKKFDSLTPRVALSYQATARDLFYASYSKGFRAGGYNIRNSSTAVPPGPFRDEEADAFEIGAKTNLLGDTLRLNAALFHTTIKDVQRTVNIVTALGTQATLLNAGDIRVQGFEADATLRLARGLVLQGTAGYTDGKYTKIIADLNNDGRVDAADLALKIPRLAPWTYGASLIYDTSIGSAGSLTLQADYNYRDGSFFTDSNFPTETLPSFNNVFVTASFSPASMPGMQFSLYGRNLLDEDNYGLNTSIRTLPQGGNLATPTKGRTYGAEVSWRF